MIQKLYKFTCADCGLEVIHQDRDAARKRGWAIARDGKTCYCPACALKHRNAGRKSAQAMSGEQLSFGGVGNA